MTTTMTMTTKQINTAIQTLALTKTQTRKLRRELRGMGMNPPAKPFRVWPTRGQTAILVEWDEPRNSQFHGSIEIHPVDGEEKLHWVELNEYGYRIAVWETQPPEEVHYAGPYTFDDGFLCPSCGGWRGLDANNSCSCREGVW